MTVRTHSINSIEDFLGRSEEERIIIWKKIQNCRLISVYYFQEILFSVPHYCHSIKIGEGSIILWRHCKSIITKNVTMEEWWSKSVTSFMDDSPVWFRTYIQRLTNHGGPWSPMSRSTLRFHGNAPTLLKLFISSNLFDVIWQTAICYVRARTSYGSLNLNKSFGAQRKL